MCHCTLAPRGTQDGCGLEQRPHRDRLVGLAMDQKNRRRIGPERGRRSRQHPGIADDGGRLCGPREADMQRHHRALAEADERKAVIAEFHARELGVGETRSARRPRFPTPRFISCGSMREIGNH